MAQGKWKHTDGMYLLLVLDGTGNIRYKAVFNTTDEAWDFYEEHYTGQEGTRKAQVLSVAHKQNMGGLAWHQSSTGPTTITSGK